MMLTITNLDLKTNEFILQNASYTFGTGTIYGIVARNGMGKTTLFRAINNLKKYSGTITFDNRPVTKARQDIFYFESENWLNPSLSGIDHLKFVQQAWHSTIPIDTVINYWKMQDYVKHPIKTYSLGMKQKLLIALYQLSDAKYLIMDEISNGLDESSRQMLHDLMTTFKSQGKLVLVSSHYKEDLTKVCDHLVTFDNKQLVSET